MYQGHPKIRAWREERELVIACLHSLADQLDKFHNSANKAGIAGSALGVGGSVVGLSLAAVAPFCAGVSLVPGIVIGAGSGVVGTATSAVGKIADKVKKKKVFRDVDGLLEDDERCTEEVKGMAERLDEAEDIIQRFLAELVESNLDDEGSVADSMDAPPRSCSDPGFMLPPVPYQPSSVPPSKSGSDLNADQVIAIAKKVNKGIRILRSMNILRVRQVLNIGKTFVKDGATAGKQAMRAVKIGKVAKVGGIVVTLVLLPFEIRDLLKQVNDMKKGKGHPSSEEILGHAKKLQDGIEIVEKEMYGKLSEINNLMLLIQFIKKHGCGRELNLFLNQIVKKLLPYQDIIKAFDKVEATCEDKVQFSLDEEEISGILLNYSEASSSVFRELAVMLWCSWQMGNKSFVFLQNTTFTAPPPIWTLFGASLNSYGTDSEGGVSILLPSDFQGNVLSHYEFPDSADWHGRCLLVNVEINETIFTLVNLLAPEESMDRGLFLQEAANFIERYRCGMIITAANFQQEVRTMTVEARKYQVCPNTPWRLMEKFLPYREIAEYLLNILPIEIDEPGIKVHEVCADLTIDDPQMVFIDWKRCKKPIVSVNDCSTQIDAILKLGLKGLWRKKNPRTEEFSAAWKNSKDVASCSKAMEFFVARDLVLPIKSCSLDHDLRFLGFTKEAVLKFGAK